MDPPPDESGGAPDSWETADLDEAVGRLMLSSSRASPAPSSSDFPADDDGIARSASSVAIASAEGVVGPSDEAIAQVDQFLREALQNPRERLSVLRIEQDVLKFIRDPTQQQFEVPPLPTSYLRLAAHRVAQHYYLQSMVLPDTNLPDGSSSRILICKTSARCCFPSIRLADIPLNISQEERSNKQNVAIKQRPQNRGSAKGGSSAKSSSGSNGKSVEERKEEYNKARARIFNLSNGPGGALGGNLSVDSSAAVANHVHNSTSVGPPSSVNNSILEEPDFYAVRRTSSDTSIGGNGSQTGIIKTDKELFINRNKASNRVAIFRDLEVDRKDPDYNRSYDKYMQRFDPGFGFSASTYSMQPLYAPALNYNTEFPQLSSGGHRPLQVQSIEHHIPPLAQHHVHGQWAGAPPSPNTIGYPPPETIMLQPSYSPGPVGAHRSSNMYHLHSSQYACPPRVAYVHPHEHIYQNFAQSHQQPDSSFGLARPR